MTRQELTTKINIVEQLIPKGHNRPGEIIKPIYITIHNTSNSNLGADAVRHSKFVRETGYYVLNGKKNPVSWHYTVDDKMVIQQLPTNEKAFHARTEANSISLAIEICMHQGINQNAANLKTAQLVSLLCFDLKIPIANIVTHKKWTGKNCPELLLKNWNGFISDVRANLDYLKQNNLSQFLAKNNFIEDSTIALCWKEEQTYLELETIENTGTVQFSFNKFFF